MKQDLEVANIVMAKEDREIILKLLKWFIIKHSKAIIY